MVYECRLRENCDVIGQFCFKRELKKAIEDESIDANCFPACKFLRYSLNLAGMESLKSDYRIKNFFLQSTTRLSDFVMIPNYNSFDEDDFLESKEKLTSVIQVTFDDLEALKITKDAKITISGMIGNIGGTLGVFIGFSFLGIFQILFEYFKKIFNYFA